MMRQFVCVVLRVSGRLKLYHARRETARRSNKQRLHYHTLYGLRTGLTADVFSLFSYSVLG